MRSYGPLEGSTSRFMTLSGPDLMERCGPFQEWIDARTAAHVLPYSRQLGGRVGPRADVRSETGELLRGINLASQDYLGLAGHEAVLAAAREVVDVHGVHSAGSPMLLGNTAPSLALERDLAEFLHAEHVLLFPTGWGAGFAVIAGLVRPSDHVVLDRLSHSCLQQGAMAATPRIHRTAHLDVEAMIAKIREIRSEDAENGILVVTEGLFSMDSDVPEMRPLIEACRECRATLVVDVAHDLGQLGPSGTGSLGAQGLLGEVDLIMGSFSKTFASNGGFIATRSRATRTYLKFFGGPHVFSNALSPAQAAVVGTCLRIVRSPEGDSLRSSLAQNVITLRAGLAQRGIGCFGSPSAIVPVRIGSERVGRLASRALARHGVAANLVEFPAVSAGEARFRCQVMATHAVADMERAAEAIAAALAEGAREAESCGPAAARA